MRVWAGLHGMHTCTCITSLWHNLLEASHILVAKVICAVLRQVGVILAIVPVILGYGHHTLLYLHSTHRVASTYQ